MLAGMTHRAHHGPIGEALRQIGARAARRRRRLIRLGARRYRRPRDLPRLIAAPPHWLDDPRPAAAKAVIARLKAALRRSLRDRRSGHWRYCRHRHLALLQALSGEMRRLASRADHRSGGGTS